MVTKEQIVGFEEAYKFVKSKGFENYFCMGNTTWKEARQKFKSGLILKDELALTVLKYTVEEIIKSKKRGIAFCSKCKRIWDFQEKEVGFTECEHCARENKNINKEKK